MRKRALSGTPVSLSSELKLLLIALGCVDNIGPPSSESSSSPTARSPRPSSSGVCGGVSSGPYPDTARSLSDSAPPCVQLR